MQELQEPQPNKLASRAALEIAKELVSADYQKHAAAKRFEAQKELLLQEKRNVEAQLSHCRQQNSELHTYLQRSEEVARSMTERCRTLDIARKNEESLRLQAETRESSLFNLLVAEESRRSQQEMAQIDLEKKISQIHCTNTIFDHLENTISDLKAKLLEQERTPQVAPVKEGTNHDLELQISELKLQNQFLQEDVQRLKKRAPEIESASPLAVEKITKTLLEQQNVILKEKEALQTENLRLSRKNLSLKVLSLTNLPCIPVLH
jgi:hypothetical protein